MTNEAKQNAAPCATMVRVDIDGWTLFKQGEGYLVRDLDLAGQAEMADPHKIRGVIRKCSEDALFPIVETIPLGERNGALALAVPEVIEIGSGAHREVTAYYLNREAALHVVMRLRTPKAVALQVAIVKVFLRAVEGPPVDPALTPKATGMPLTPRQAEVLAYLKAYFRTFGAPPTRREIGAHFGIGSTNAVNDHLVQLESRGAIRLRRDGRSRGIILPPEPAPAPEVPAVVLQELADLRAENAKLAAALASVVSALSGYQGLPPIALPAPAPESPLEAHLKAERNRIIDALESNDWNRSKAAQRAGFARRTFYRRLRRYGIQ